MKSPVSVDRSESTKRSHVALILKFIKRKIRPICWESDWFQ